MITSLFRQFVILLFVLSILYSPVFIRSLYAAGVQLPKTGQTISYAAGDDGAIQAGAAWPNPRFTDNGNGTVTDNLTSLVWLKNANCFGAQLWLVAITSANMLASGTCGLTDGSVAGQWHLPSISELESLVDSERYNPPLPLGHPFSSVLGAGAYYWSSSGFYNFTTSAWVLYMGNGDVGYNPKTYSRYVWPVRAGW